MNEFPKFHPNEPALIQLSSVRLNKISLGQKSNQVQPGVGYRTFQTAGGTTVSSVKKRTQAPILPPLWVTTYGDGTTSKIYAEPAYVVPRHNDSGSFSVPILITAIPSIEYPLVVTVGDKVYVKITINVNGKVTAAAFEKGTSWPNDLPPVLVGGNLGGASGHRYYRVAEFAGTVESLTKTQILTGHIDHFQPTLVDNLISSPSTGEARVLKEWNSAQGRWDLRYLVAGDGIEIEEIGNTIVISNTLYTYTP